MATIKLNTATDMTLLSENWGGGYASGSQPGEYAIVSMSPSYVAALTVLGSFDMSDFAGPINRVLFDDRDSGIANNGEITGPLPAMGPNLWLQLSNMWVGQAFSILLGGNDTAHGSAGNDVIWTFGGNDLIFAGRGRDSYFGGSGTDTVSYFDATTGLLAGLEENGITGAAAGDRYDSIENLIGSRFNDILYGSPVVNALRGGAGNDKLIGKGGADILDGGLGSDMAAYDAQLNVGLRVDLLMPSRNTEGAVGDRYIGIENLAGSTFDDELFGNNAANIIWGNLHPNLESGSDKMFGRGGNDHLLGFSGNDDLNGDLGADQLTGGVGADDFIFASVADSRVSTGRDTILDFSRAQGDRIVLSAIDANTKLAGNQAFSFIGAGAFTGATGQLRFQKIGTDTHVQADINGDAVADFAIISNVPVSFIKADFVL